MSLCRQCAPGMRLDWHLPRTLQRGWADRRHRGVYWLRQQLWGPNLDSRENRRQSKNIHTYIHTYIRTYVRTYVRTYIHTHIHAYMHTYIHTLLVFPQELFNSETITWRTSLFKVYNFNAKPINLFVSTLFYAGITGSIANSSRSPSSGIKSPFSEDTELESRSLFNEKDVETGLKSVAVDIL